MFESIVFAAATAALPIPLPDASTPLVTVQAGGVQVYRCVSSASQPPAWVLDRPVATLYREDGSAFGTHAAGPTWTANDGSAIVANAAAPIVRLVQPAAVPRLALRVVSHTGSGLLADVRYVERFDMAGGMAPNASECTADRVGQTRAVHYSAVYEFIR